MTVIWDVPGVTTFVAAHTKSRDDWGEHRVAGVFKDKNLVAGVIFRNWSPEYGVVEVVAAATDPKWASRSVLDQLFGYAFGIAQTCVARTDESNHRVRRLWKAFGAEEHVIPRLRGRTASEAILVLTDDAWNASRFMRQKHGQTKGSKAA